MASINNLTARGPKRAELPGLKNAPGVSAEQGAKVGTAVNAEAEAPAAAKTPAEVAAQREALVAEWSAALEGARGAEPPSSSAGSDPANAGQSLVEARLSAASSSRPDDTAVSTGFEGPHQRARFEKPASYPARRLVPDSRISFDVPDARYRPQEFTADVVFANDSTRNPKGWADPPVMSEASLSTRLTYENGGEVRFGPPGADGGARPLNPMGRTGLAGRGQLGKWGPNQAADPIVVRVSPETGVPEMLAIKRKDTGEWAIPGGMVDGGEEAIAAAARELFEEAAVSLDFSDAAVIYRGYVDDPRNTDNAWMETTAAVKLLSDAEAASLTPRAGSDAKQVRWVPLDADMFANLYASHGKMVKSALAHLEKTGALSGHAPR